MAAVTASMNLSAKAALVGSKCVPAARRPGAVEPFIRSLFIAFQ
jgi:hypothetical protein